MNHCIYGNCDGYHPPCDNCGLAWQKEEEVSVSPDEEAQWTVEAKRFCVDKPYEEPA